MKGTTTDPVQKAMELLPIGPVVIIDTPGLDDEELGEQRVAHPPDAAQNRCGGAGAGRGAGETEEDRALLALVKARQVPYVLR